MDEEQLTLAAAIGIGGALIGGGVTYLFMRKRHDQTKAYLACMGNALMKAAEILVDEQVPKEAMDEFAAELTFLKAAQNNPSLLA